MKVASLAIVVACSRTPQLERDDAPIESMRESTTTVETLHAFDTAAERERQAVVVVPFAANGCDDRPVMPCWCFDLKYRVATTSEMGCQTDGEVLRNIALTGFRPPPSYVMPGDR